MKLTKTAIRSFLAAGLLTAGTLAPAPALAEEVYMIRGFLNVFSAGMNQMTNRLKRAGVNAKAISNGQWRSVADDIIRRARQDRVSHPIIITGHSLGGVEAPAFANYLGRNGVTVDLVIGLDPGFDRPRPFGAGVKQVINYKIPSGHNYRRGSGFSGSLSNIDVSAFTRTDHVGIDKDRNVQDVVVRKIRARVGK